MKIALGTTSKGKKKSVEEGLKKAFSTFTLIPVSVESGVSEQPLSIDETVLGAKNRAQRAYDLVPQANISFGLEGGMYTIQGHHYYFGVVALFDGTKIHLGISDSLPLPKEVSDLVHEGGSAGQVIREYLHKHPDDESLKIVADPIINRGIFFRKAIANVIMVYDSKEHY